MLTDGQKTKTYAPKRRTAKDVNKWYPDSQKLDAVKLWLLIGNLSQVAATLNIPLPTVKHWRYSKWWEELCQEIRQENKVQLSTRLKQIASKALDVTMDRLENGDFFLNKMTGEIDRKPVAMRDAYLVAAGTLDRAKQIDDKPQEEINKQTMDRLEALAKTFASFSKKVKRIEVEEGAFSEKREAGLRSGTSVGVEEETIEVEGSSEESPGPKDRGEGSRQPPIKQTSGPQESSNSGGIELSEQSSCNFSPIQSS